ncbi:hypothetical protein MKW94_028233 [Papaver nudicaule]|uniref:HTH myb-type domain-containing protein n=1 Tax=Papaver nudicaule TaxID=74823 RepID=A0AA41VZG9_PAPNU|nr:hypothetical protein [Papaver nudicaule]
MNRHSVITLNQTESPKGMASQAYCNIASPIPDFTDTANKITASHADYSSTFPLLYSQSESVCSSKSPMSYPFKSCKLSAPHLEPDSSMSYDSLPQYPKNTFSRSSTFCTSLYLSSSTSSEAHRHLGNLPFLPHPMKTEKPVSDVHSTKSPSEQTLDLNSQFDDEHSEYLMDFLNTAGEASDGSFHGVNYAADSLTFNEQLDLQFLSDELDMAITDNGENPRVDEIFEAPIVSSTPLVEMTNNQSNLQPLVQPIAGQTPSGEPSPGAASAHKPRMRWTPELHERFIEAVKKLDGAEKATPKGILKRMDVEGLTIYHVKSHLQKYRLAKYMPETKEDKKTSSCEEKERKASSSNSGTDGLKRGLHLTEALRMQMEVQKQLHEQLEVQRSLQIRIEEHARYLQKIMEEQEKVGKGFMPATDYKGSSSTNTQTQAEDPNQHSEQQSDAAAVPPHSESVTESCSSSLLSKKQDPENCTETEQQQNLSGHKRVRDEAKPPETSADNAATENPADSR